VIKKNVALAVDLRNGNIISEIQLQINNTMPLYIDLKIINITEGNFTYGIMTNNQLIIFQNTKEIFKLNANPNELFIFMEYNKEELILGNLALNENKIHVKSNKEELFNFSFVKELDALAKIKSDVIIVKIPPHYKNSSITLYHLNDLTNFTIDFSNDRYEDYEVKQFIEWVDSAYSFAIKDDSVKE